MDTVTLYMTDEITEEEVVRTIDITNAMISNSIGQYLGDEEDQRKQLEEWIDKRGNKQHKTLLTLNKWEIN